VIVVVHEPVGISLQRGSTSGAVRFRRFGGLRRVISFRASAPPVS